MDLSGYKPNDAYHSSFMRQVDGMDQNIVGIVLNITGIFIFMFNFGIVISPVIQLYILEITEPIILPYTILANWFFGGVIVTLFVILWRVFPNNNCYPFFIILLIINVIALFMIKFLGI